MSSARHYFPRSPRYIFQAEENSLVRFAPMEAQGQVARAVMQNLSETGLSFTVPLSENIQSLPEEGTALKIEFPIPGRNLVHRSTIACFATVTRIDEIQEWSPDWGDQGYYIVALQFRHLPTLHLRAIKNALAGRVDEEGELNWQRVRRMHAFAFSGMTLALSLCFYAMSLPASAWRNFFF